MLSVSLAMMVATLGAGGASAADAPPASPSQITDSAQVDGPTVVEGQLDVSGSAEGGEVLLYAWPANEELHRMEVGESLPIDAVARAEVSDEGEFALKVEDAEALESVASRDGSVNLTVVGQADGEQFSQDVGVQVKDVEAAEGQSEAVVDLGDVEPAGEAVPSAAGPAVVDAYTQKSSGCSTEKVANIGDRWVPVGGVFSTNPGGTIDFQYRSGQSSSLGVAVSSKGPNSGFSAGGTNSVKSTATVDFPTQRGKSSRLARTMFHYAKFKTRAGRLCGSGGHATSASAYQIVMKQ